MAEQTWTVQAVLDAARDFLQKRGLDSARLDSELLLAEALGLRRLDLYLQFDRPLSEAERAPFRALLKRRAAHEPVAYILGQREFYGLDFAVGPGVLVPRPETELMVDATLEFFAQKKPLAHPPARFVELCLGTACVSISLLKSWNSSAEDEVGKDKSSDNAPGQDSGSRWQKTWALGVDISPDALRYAHRNAEKHNVINQLYLIQADLAEALRPAASPAQAWPLILANPPYVSADEWSGLMADVRDYEPRLALVSQEEGLAHSRRIALWIRDNLAQGGLALIEGADARGPALLDLYQDILGADFDCALLRDLSGRDRLLRVQRSAS